MTEPWIRRTQKWRGVGGVEMDVQREQGGEMLLTAPILSMCSAHFHSAEEAEAQLLIQDTVLNCFALIPPFGDWSAPAP